MPKINLLKEISLKRLLTPVHLKEDGIGLFSLGAFEVTEHLLTASGVKMDNENTLLEVFSIELNLKN